MSSSCSSDRFQLHFEGIFSLLFLQLLGFFSLLFFQLLGFFSLLFLQLLGFFGPDSIDFSNQFCDLLLEFYQGRVALHFSELSLHLRRLLAECLKREIQLSEGCACSSVVQGNQLFLYFFCSIIEVEGRDILQVSLSCLSGWSDVCSLINVLQQPFCQDLCSPEMLLDEVRVCSYPFHLCLSKGSTVRIQGYSSNVLDLCCIVIQV